MHHQILFITLSFVVSVFGHGKLSEPASRGGVGYEEGPVSGANGDDFVCRNPTAGTPAVTLTAGTKTSLKWGFGAAHFGDCALFLSYDHDKVRNEQKYFKIANLPDCNIDSNQQVEVNLPTWLPPGQAIMRWDWYALHVYPTVEFYVQCVDVTIVSASTKTAAEIPSYKIAGQYPLLGDQAAGKFWSPYDNPVWKMEGPPCAPDIDNNCCDTSGYARTGFIKSQCANSGSVTTAAPTPSVMSPTILNTPSPTIPGETPPSECVIYVVQQGDYMTKITNALAEDGFTVTPLELCRFNKGSDVDLSACDVIYPGDNLVVPDSTGSCLKNPQDPQGSTGVQDPQGSTGVQDPQDSKGVQDPQDSTGVQDPQDSTGVQDPQDSAVVQVIPSLIFLVSLAALCII